MPDPARDAMVDFGPWHIKKASLHERIRALEAELAAARKYIQVLELGGDMIAQTGDMALARAEALSRQLAEARSLLIETDPHRTYRAGCPVCEFLKATRPEEASHA